MIIMTLIMHLVFAPTACTAVLSVETSLFSKFNVF